MRKVLGLTVIGVALVLGVQVPGESARATLAASELHLRLVRDGRTRFHVEAEATVAAPKAVVWDTIRDYDHLARFVPMLVTSHRTQYNGRPVIEQVGRATFMFIHFDAKAVLEETFDPAADSLTLRAVAGDFVRFESSWHVTSISPTVTSINVTSEAQLKRWIPQWLERWQVRKTLAHSLRALLIEMERRAQS